jgi:hypothetical protein
MEKISKTELYQRGIPLLAFLPMLALLNGATVAAAVDEWELASPASSGLNPTLLQTLVQKIRAGEFENIHGLLVVRNGKLVLDLGHLSCMSLPLLGRVIRSARLKLRRTILF